MSSTVHTTYERYLHFIKDYSGSPANAQNNFQSIKLLLKNVLGDEDAFLISPTTPEICATIVTKTSGSANEKADSESKILLSEKEKERTVNERTHDEKV